MRNGSMVTLCDGAKGVAGRPNVAAAAASAANVEDDGDEQHVATKS